MRGDNINELLSFILKEEENSVSEELRHLIASSYNYDKENKSQLKYSELKNEEKIVGIRRLFVPIGEDFEKESVFSNG